MSPYLTLGVEGLILILELYSLQSSFFFFSLRSQGPHINKEMSVSRLNECMANKIF